MLVEKAKFRKNPLNFAAKKTQLLKELVNILIIQIKFDVFITNNSKNKLLFKTEILHGIFKKNYRIAYWLASFLIVRNWQKAKEIWNCCLRYNLELMNSKRQQKKLKKQEQRISLTSGYNYKLH